MNITSSVSILHLLLHFNCILIYFSLKYKNALILSSVSNRYLFLTQLVACMSTSFWRTLDPEGCRIIRIVCDKLSALLSCISIVSVDL